MSDLVVRAYNVGFGDAVLVSIPERSASGRETTRHVLFDVGNLLTGAKNADEVFEGVVRDIIDRTGGAVDLYVMTHEHLDHVQGLLSAARKGLKLTAKYAWLTGSADPHYYENNPQARKRRLEMDAALGDAVRVLQATPDVELERLLWNNSTRLGADALGLSTSDYVDHLRTIAPANRTHYVDRTMKTARRHPFREAKLTILAPEADTTAYYGRLPAGELSRRLRTRREVSWHDRVAPRVRRCPILRRASTPARTSISYVLAAAVCARTCSRSMPRTTTRASSSRSNGAAGAFSFRGMPSSRRGGRCMTWASSSPRMW